MGYHQLTEYERYQIALCLRAGVTQTMMADLMGRSRSTISRELGRNGSKAGYLWRQGHQMALERRHGARKYTKLTPEVIRQIKHMLKQDLSPEQIVGYLARSKVVELCHETLYRFIARDKREGGKLYERLRIARKPYRRRYATYSQQGRIAGRVSIDQRPSIVDRRARIGDWELDTIIGHRKQSAILTLVERKTLFTVIAKLQGKDAAGLTRQLCRVLKAHRERVKTITVDNGKEFAGHQEFARRLETDVYFAHPHASGERGTIENINGLIRQYFPKGTDFNEVSAQQLQAVARRLNKRPRKTRDFRTPNELFLGKKDDLLAA